MCTFALKFTIWNKLEPCLIYVWICCEEIHYLGKCIWFDLQIYKTSSFLKCIKISLKIPVYKILKYVFVQQSCIHFTVYIRVVPHVIFVMCLCLLLQSGVSEGETEKDRLLFNCLNTLLKLLRECDLIRDAKWTDDMNLIWGKFRKMKHLARQFKQLSFFGIWLNFLSIKVN